MCNLIEVCEQQYKQLAADNLQIVARGIVEVVAAVVDIAAVALAAVLYRYW